MRDRSRSDPPSEIVALLARGEVVETLLLPQELGGSHDPRNIIWLPPEAIREKSAFESEVRRSVEAGATINYSVTPEYDSDSAVPDRLVIVSHDGRRKRTKTIDVARHKRWRGAN